jgi:CMP-N-acetylneuraminic acid synthetase
LKNVICRFSTAHLYSLRNLKAACLKFMEDNASAILGATDCLHQLSEVLMLKHANFSNVC